MSAPGGNVTPGGIILATIGLVIIPVGATGITPVDVVFSLSLIREPPTVTPGIN
jgi:hypothetical protein